MKFPIGKVTVKGGTVKLWGRGTPPKELVVSSEHFVEKTCDGKKQCYHPYFCLQIPFFVV